MRRFFIHNYIFSKDVKMDELVKIVQFLVISFSFFQFIESKEMCGYGKISQTYCDLCYNENYFWKWYICYCCKMNSTWYCVASTSQHPCEAVAESTTVSPWHSRKTTTGWPWQIPTTTSPRYPDDPSTLSKASSSLNVSAMIIGISITMFCLLLGCIFIGCCYRKYGKTQNRRPTDIQVQATVTNPGAGTRQNNPVLPPPYNSVYFGRHQHYGGIHPDASNHVYSVIMPDYKQQDSLVPPPPYTEPPPPYSAVAKRPHEEMHNPDI